MWQPTNAQWWCLALVAMLIVVAWPPRYDRSLAMKVVNWAVEGGAPNVLYREGWKPTSLKSGDRVTIMGSRAKNGSNLINATSFKLPDGRCVFAGTSGPGGTGTPNCTVGRR